MNEAADAAILEPLRSHHLFAALDDAQLQRIAGHVRRIELDAGETLFHRDDPADRFFLVARGQVKLYRLSPDGQEKVVEIFGVDQSFGEAVMFLEAKRFPVSVAALERTVVLAIPAQPYLAVLREDVDACFRLLADMSARLHRRLNDVDQLSLANAAHRVVRYLLNQLPAEAADGVVIELPHAKQVIASRLSIKPETLSRVLGNLSNAGFVQVKGRRITVLDVHALKTYA